MLIRNLLRLILLASILSSCAPPPGDILYPGIFRPAELEEVDITITIGIIDTQRFCNSVLPSDLVATNCLTNLCFIPACARVRWGDDGIITTCEVYSWANIDFLIEHELRHCMGYRDVY